MQSLPRPIVGLPYPPPIVLVLVSSQSFALLAPSFPHLLFLRREFLTLGLGKILELFFGHRLGHLFRRAFEARFAGFAALGCQCCASGHLLFFRFCRHNP
jgi:hypothetical protein